MSKTHVYSGDESRRPVLVAGIRTPFQKAGTGLAKASAADLGVWAVKELLARTELEPEAVDEVILGCVGQESKEANVARVVSLRAGMPHSTPAYTVHRNCASGLQAIDEGARRIAMGEGSIYIVGGTESMSSYPILFSDRLKAVLERLMGSKTLFGKLRVLASIRPSFLKPRISLLEGLTDPTCGLIMGLTAENLARDFGITREEQDRFALESHSRAAQAWNDGLYADEVFALYPPPKYEPTGRDNSPRQDQSLEALAKLRPYFDRTEGSVTVGNSCPITDGAAALCLMSEAEARSRGMRPLGRLLSSAVSGLDPSRMGLGPAYAAPAALEAKGMACKDVDVWEINEAFAAQVLACSRALDSETFCRDELGASRAFGAPDAEKINPRGGALAIGHPVGATGSRLVLGLLRQMEGKGGGLGVATLCVGGGQGAAQVWEAA
ncbi:MAG: acetyl-CoA C-acyltransferase [Planctomycetota bacterium]